jgi:predicted nucleic acid-binding protein
MIRSNIGIDTSVLVRLVTGQPPDLFALCVERLSALCAAGAEVLASNQVIGEAYVTLQRHYGVSKEDARAELHTTLTSGLVAPLNGRAVLDALAASGGPGLFDRLIANDYARAGLDTLTLDRRMASLPHVSLIAE